MSKNTFIATWGTEGSVITDPANREKIRQAFEESDLIVRHWFLYGSSAPDRMIFSDFEEFKKYLRHKVKPGDALDIWSFEDVCRQDNLLLEGKKPDAEGRVPKGGAY